MLTRGITIPLDNAMAVTCYAIGGVVLGERPPVPTYDENDISIALLIQYGRVRYFTGSDIEHIAEEQIEDPVAELDRQLSASLTEFDGMLLKEMETIESESEAKMRDLAQEAAQAAKRLKEKGVDLGTDESKSDDSESTPGEEGRQGKAGDTDESGQEKSAESQQGEGDDTVAAADSAKGEGSGPKRDPGSRYSKEDDDIVARQLREAAEKETDPELKEKLWKEYEEYKNNTQ